MKNKDFKLLLAHMRTMSAHLTDAQRSTLTEMLRAAPPAPPKPLAKTPLHIAPEPQHCPHCQSATIVRRGVYNRLQRYYCKDCGKTFNAVTGTPLARLRNKEQLATYAQCRAQNMTLRETARTMGASVYKAWHWSHRVDLDSITPPPAKVAGDKE